MNRKKMPTDSELSILQVLWTYGPCTVRFVNEVISREKKVGYTTTLKLMQIMTEKKLLARNEQERTHVYSALVSEAETQHGLIHRFVDTAFGGSAKKMMIQALGSCETTREELEEIKRIIRKIESTK